MYLISLAGFCSCSQTEWSSTIFLHCVSINSPPIVPVFPFFAHLSAAEAQVWNMRARERPTLDATAINLLGTEREGVLPLEMGGDA